MHSGVVAGATETYVMPVVGSSPNLAFVPSPSGIGIVGSELLVDYGFNQGLSFPASDSYGYFVTGFESPAEWAGHHSTSSIDGQDLHLMGVLPESLPYLYHAPDYAYSQSPYTAIVPGIATGHDNSITESQQFYNNALYQPSISPPNCIPVIVQPDLEFVPANTIDSSIFSNDSTISDRPANNSTKSKASNASAGIAPLSRANASAVAFDHSQPSHQHQSTSESSIRLQNSYPRGNKLSSQGSTKSGVGTCSKQNAGKDTAAPNNAFTCFVSSSHERASAYHYEGGVDSNGTPNIGGQNIDAIGEQNRGPWTSKVHSRFMPSGDDLAKSTASNSASRSEGSIIINPDNYNRDDFFVDYPDAMFFVIKSYSEDDVHKSIKYNVWSSTSRGNWRLDSAYEEAQRKSIDKSRSCPVFLFFSVNASGQFCGVAEMIGRVDFDKDMHFWQHDKWSGSFPVKWHIIKDVANTSLRHIILKNNENKPVTYSRDAQEIPYSTGINMLKIFKNCLLKTSILDDFMFYEERQLKLLAEKLRHHGRKSASYFHEPAYIIKNKHEVALNQCLQEVVFPSTRKDQIIRSFEHQPDTRSDKQPKSQNDEQDFVVHKSMKGNGEQQDTVEQLSGANVKQSSTTVVFTAEQEAPDKLSTDVSDKHRNLRVDHTDTVVVHHAKLDANCSTHVTNEPPNLEPQKVADEESRAKLDLVQNSVSDSANSLAANDVSTEGPIGGQNKAKAEGSMASDTKEDIKADSASEVEGGQSDLLSTDPEGCVGKLSNAIDAYDVVIVGSMYIKVKDFGECSAGGFGAGTVSVETKAPKLVKKGILADATKPKK